MFNDYRTEKDSMGDIQVPSSMLYGASTQRAVNNFNVLGRTLPKVFYKALAELKYSCAKVNYDLGLISSDISKAIMAAALEVRDGKYDEHFVVDVYQTGSGTSANMNFNEVVSNIINKNNPNLKVHPNDHINKGQSSNDTIPSTIHISCLMLIHNNLIPELEKLYLALNLKASEFSNIVKSGRTHFQDAVPITLGQEFSGYAKQIRYSIERINTTIKRVSELAIGGTAVGTGINTHKKFGSLVCNDLSERLGFDLFEASNHFEAQGSKDACVELSGALKTTACSLMKISNDIRFLSSGPRMGICEITLPEIQPGSSIMPGKINPVICESVCQVAAKVMGNDLTVSIAGQSGNLELNVMMPVIAECLIESITILANVSNIFNYKCIAGIGVNLEVCNKNIENNLIVSTALVPKLGYDVVAKITKEAYRDNLSIRQVVIKNNLLSSNEIDTILDPMKMV